MSAKQANRLQYDEPPRHREGILNESSEDSGVSGEQRGVGGIKDGKPTK